MSDDYQLRTLASFIHEAVGAEKHRLYVSQFLASTERPGILNQLFEFVDNAIDESIETYDRMVELVRARLGDNYVSQVPPCHVVVKIHPTNEVEVMDTGRGVPCGTSPSSGEPVIYKIYESDSAGGKGGHSRGAYKSITAGQHGAGAAVAKSCTEYFNVVTITCGEDQESTGQFMLSYTKGMRAAPLQKTADELQLSDVPVLRQLGVYKTGTWLKYKYDDTLFRCKENGMDVEPYDKGQIINRIKPMLLGLKNRNSIRVTIAFKDEQPEIIDPNEYTPELFLEAGNFPVHSFHIASPTGTDVKNAFESDVYLTLSGSGMNFTSTTVVNRLLLAQSGANKMIEERIKEALRRLCDSEFLLSDVFTKDERQLIEDGRLMVQAVNEIMMRVRVLVVMGLARAEFSGQTKSVLVNTDYQTDFKRALGNHLSSTKGHRYLRTFLPVAQDILKSKLKYKKIERKEQARMEQAQATSLRLKNEANKILNSPLAALQRKINLISGDNDTRFTYKASSFPVDESYLVLVEGASAATSLGDIIDLPITVIGMLGKPPNVLSGKEYDPNQLAMLSIELQKSYKGLLLLTDADSDALHIRILLMALTWQQAPLYMTQGRMYIINSPHARITNGNDQPVTINMRGTAITYPPNISSLTKSPTETELALRLKGVYMNEKYGGLADCLTDGEGDIVLVDLVQDPSYRSQLAPPTNEEIARLREILQDSSDVKRDFTAKLCTQRLNYARWMYNVDATRVPRLDLFTQRYRFSPAIEGHQLYYIHTGNI